MMEERIRKAVEAALKKAGAGSIDFIVERPADMTHGDYAVNVAFAAAKELGQNPRDIANGITEAVRSSLGEDAARVEVAGAGFVNVTLSSGAIARDIARAASEGEAWGRGTEDADKRIIIEYGNPNPFKEMHIGHLMGAIIGEALSRLLESSGAHVARDTFGGDVGPHVAKALWGLRKAGSTEPANATEIGRAYAHASQAYEKSEETKKEIDGLNQEIYEIVAEAEHPESLRAEKRTLLNLWRIGREISMKEFERLYRIIGTRFDYTFFDSDTTDIGIEVVKDGLAKGIFEESDGAIIYRGEKKGLFTLVFITSRGTPTYETKDVGLAFLKEERYPSNRSIIVTASEQTGHFKVFLAALEDIAPLLAKKTTHVAHGFLRLASGKMSSREGNVITAATLLDDVFKKASKKNEDPIVAEQVAVGAVKYMIWRQAAGADVVFDPEKSLSLEGDSGPYLQYAYVRAKSVLASASARAVPEASGPESPYLLERLIVRFPEVVARARSDLAPHHVTQYLTALAGEWNSFYAKERIIGGAHETYKLSLTQAFATTMKNGLWLLGIPVPEKM